MTLKCIFNVFVMIKIGKRSVCFELMKYIPKADMFKPLLFISKDYVTKGRCPIP